MDNRLQIMYNQACQHPIIIWGTKTAGKICYRLLRKLNVKIAAAGDNNSQKTGKKFYELSIMSAEQIKDIYPGALIFICSFSSNVADSIMFQLKGINGGFSFFSFGQIEYLYETAYLKRTIRDRDKFFQIVNNVSKDEEKPWEQKLNKNVMSEYRYIVRDDCRAEDLKKVLSAVYGVKKLVLIIGSEMIEGSAALIEELSKYDSIGHIIVVTDCEGSEPESILGRMADKVFYAVCGQGAKKTGQALENAGFLVEEGKLPEDMFSCRNKALQTELTEDSIVRSVLQFTNGKLEGQEYQAASNANPVHIVQLVSGLANQVLIYLFGRFLEEESGRTVIFDDTLLNLDIYDEDENVRRISRALPSMPLEEVRMMVSETRKRNGFYYFKRAEVAEVFDIPIHLLSDYFDEETWKAYLLKARKELSVKYSYSFPLGQVLMENGIDIEVVKDGWTRAEFLEANNSYYVDTYILERPYGRNSMTNFLMHRGQNTYYIGIWATGKVKDWLLYNRKWVRDSLRFRLELNEKNRDYVKEITQADGVMIHIRRGDFVYCGMSADMDYFQKAIQIVEAIEKYKNKKYFIFSDDLDWCEQHEEELGIDKVKDRVLFVAGNMGGSSYVDMYLMSLGKIIIPTPGSTFGYVAMLVSETIEKSVDIPKYLYGLKYGISSGPEIIDIKQGI
ncbi:MAG: alpha-1,2-fucosyltransferase [Lachnospiraceae bacterium]|nr:alpha-1,2-fucosyltransferase [Lachnospiraceae bacterium]